MPVVTKIMEEAGIPVFSVSETIGHKTEHQDYLPTNWFGKNDEGTDALVLFSFTEDEKAARAMEILKRKNAESHTAFPIRGFILPVESFGY